jgi:hypothetical protein
MHYELSFSVTNVSRTTNGEEMVDLSWRNFAIQGDFGAGNVSINHLVPDYLQQHILLQTQFTGSISGLQEVKTWYLNNLIQRPVSSVPLQTRNLSIFNFSSLAQPLPNWQVQQDLPKSRIMLQSATGFNLTYVVQVTEAGEVTSFVFNAINTLKVSIGAPLPARVTNDALVLETGAAAWWPELMLITIIASFTLLIGTYLAERRLQSRKPSRSGKRARR